MSREWKEQGTINIEFGDETYTLELTGTFSHELDGQDADGNRGVWRTFCDGMEIDDIDPTPETEGLKKAIEDYFYNKHDCDDVNWQGIPDEPEPPDCY